MAEHPTQIGPYEIRGVIASGGMGVVYRARHVETGLDLALKTMRAPRERTIESIRREVHTLSRIRHPGIVRLVSHGLHEGLPWYAMELVQGETLRDRLRDIWSEAAAGRGKATGTAAGGCLPEILTLICRLCQTLAYLHGEGLVHRDLKPANVVVREGDMPTIVDFGIAQRFAGAAGREALEVDFAGAGTLDFMAPEQIRGGEIDARVDLYALGCILFAALCGRPPFRDDPELPLRLQHISVEPPAPSSLVRGVPPSLDALVVQLLAKEPSARPGYAHDVAAALAALGGRPSPALAEPPPRSYLYKPPFTGQAELSSFLEDELACAKEGRGRCVLLSGPSGSGKTRLAMEVARAAHGAGMVVLSGECAPFGVPEGDGASSAPLQAFAALLRHAAARCRQDGADATHRVLGAHCRVLEEHEPALAVVPGREAYVPPPQLPARDAAERAERSVVEVLARCSALEPLLLIVDDAQWADDLSLGVLRLLANAPPMPLHALVLITCRSESRRAEIDALRTAPRVLPLSIDPLTIGDVGRIAAGMTAIEDIPRPFVEFLAEQSGGTPFFVAEYLKAAVAEGLMTRCAGRWQLRVGAEDGPGAYDPALGSSGALKVLERLGSVGALLARRLDGLEPDTQAVVKLGAVLGRTWDEELARATAGLGEERLLDAIEELRARHVLIEAEGGTLRFAHDSIRETVYAAMTPDERRSLHLRAAEAIEAADRGPGVYDLLARHYRIAGAPAKAFLYAERAGRHALKAGAVHEASEHLAAAIELADAESSGVALSPLERGQLLRSHGDALYAMGDLERMGQRMAEVSQRMGVAELPRSGAGWVALLIAQAGVQIALWALPPRWLHASAEQRRSMAEAAYALERLGELQVYRDVPLEFLATRLLAANLAERAGDSGALAWVHVNMAMALTAVGLRTLGRRYLESSRIRARRSGDLDTELYQLQVEGFVWTLCGDLGAAKRTLDAALERSHAAGAVYRAEQILTVIGILRERSGDFVGSTEIGRMLRDSAVATSRGLHLAFGNSFIGYGLVACGREDEALHLLEALEGSLRSAGNCMFRALPRALMAGAHLGLGELDAAVRCAIEARALLRRPPDGHPTSDAFHRYIPAVHLAAWARAVERGEPAKDAERRAVEAIRSATHHASLFPTFRSRALNHQALAARLRGEHAESRELLARSVRAAAELRIHYDEAHAWMELGRAPDATAAERRAAITRAGTLFESIGCSALAERARRARRAQG